MARRKRGSPILTHAQKRLAALKSISPKLDLGGGVSVAILTKTTNDLSTALANYNGLLSQTDGALNRIVALEKSTRELTDRALAGVLARFGKDSDEYEKAGGTRASERKRPVRKSKKPQPSPAP